MKKRQAFWDASAIVPICLYQSTSQRARQISRQTSDVKAVWWGTMAEVRSAFARALRNSRSNTSEHARALRHLQKISQSWREIEPLPKVRELTLQLLDAHPLRTGDAFQLAAALYWCDEKPRRKVFVCFDDRLAEAANDLGFQVLTV